MQSSALCRSRRELSNEYLLAKIGVDTAENEPLEVWGKLFNIIQSCPYSAACDLSLSETRPAVTAQVASSSENGSAAICAVAAVKDMPERAATKATEMLGHIKALRGYSAKVIGLIKDTSE